MIQPYDIVIRGAGISGLTCAYELLRSKKKILILSDRKVGEATSNSAGILDPTLTTPTDKKYIPFLIESLQMYSTWLRKLERKSGMKIPVDRSGLVYLAQTLKEEKSLGGRLKAHRRLGLQVDWYQPLENEGISVKIRKGLFYPEIFRVDPKQLQKALLKVVRAEGARVMDLKGKKIHLHQKDGGYFFKAGSQKFQAQKIIDARGAWIEQGVKPVRGQILILKGRLPKGPMLHSLKNQYLCKQGKSSYLLGATIESIGFTARATKKSEEQLIKSFEGMVPSVRRMKIQKNWVGFRPQTKDQLPILGEGVKKNYFYAGGYFRNGILCAPLSAKILSELILKKKESIHLKIFNPQRFKL